MDNLCNYVSQDNYKIIDISEGSLFTSGLATCSAISFIINNTSLFMAHFDAKTNIYIIAKKIIEIYKSPIHFTSVKIWYGDGFGSVTSYHTQQLINRFTEILGICIKPIKEAKEDIIHHLDLDIIQCRICKSKSGTLKIIPHYYICTYNNNIQISNVGFMETVYSH